jgi:hypothetical protein
MATATAAVVMMIVVIMIVMGSAAYMFLSVFANLYFFHTTTCWTGNLITMLTAFCARLYFPNMMTILAFKYSILYHVSSPFN